MAKKLYVGNLAWKTTEETLRLAFGEDGRSVSNVTIMTDRETGRPRGFGFVEMGSDADAQAAIEALDGAEVDGRPIRVNEAQERAPRPGGGGGGFGGGGGRGFGGGGGGGGGYGGGGGGGRGGYGGGGNGGGGGRGGYGGGGGGGRRERGGRGEQQDERW
jgi:cold-inducible RNA-binding protein